MTGWIAAKWATKAGKPVIIAIGVLLLLGIIFALGRCSKDDYEDDYREQIDQTNRSSDAAVEAAQNAIQTLEGRTATEDAVDQVVTETVNQIDGAADADEVRAIVLASVCRTPEHRNDPACAPTGE